MAGEKVPYSNDVAYHPAQYWGNAVLVRRELSSVRYLVTSFSFCHVIFAKIFVLIPRAGVFFMANPR